MPSVEVRTGSAEATRALGAALAGLLEPGDVLLLSGGLGAGKTTFTKGLVAALGSDEVVTSPTFTLLRTYATSPVVAHVDCWRLEQLDEVADLALDEILDEGGVAVVEWGEAAAPLLGRDALAVRLEPVGVASPGTTYETTPGEGEPWQPARVVRFAASSSSWEARLALLAGRARERGLEILADGSAPASGGEAVR